MKKIEFEDFMEVVGKVLLFLFIGIPTILSNILVHTVCGTIGFTFYILYKIIVKPLVEYIKIHKENVC